MVLDCKIIICGVGGQGVLFLARVLYGTARILNRGVMGSETHGMSQRGGSVTSHVKIGDYHSPMVRRGTADILIVLKAEEIYGNLRFLKRGGRLLLNADGDFNLAPEVAKALSEKEIDIIQRDATALAVRLGNPLVANLVLLSAGVKAGVFPIHRDTLIKAVESVSPSRFVQNNLMAVKAGFEP